MFHKLVYLAGIYLRNNLIFKNYKFLKKTQLWPIEQLRSYQLSKLKKLIKYANDHSSYYNKLFKENNININEIQSLYDIKKIPITTKDELIANIDQIQNMNYPEKLFFSETSGSSGKPLVFYRNKDWDAWHRASVYRGYSWYHVNPWERNGYFWGYNIALKHRFKTLLLDFLQNRFRIFSYNNDELESFISKLRNADYLEGYSSMIYEVAKFINAKNLVGYDNIKMVKGTSEKILLKYQEEVFKAFGKKIISEYGAAEAGIIAFECPYGMMHINMETVIVEEEQNEILVTNLVSYSFPIIRYKLGDYIKLKKNVICQCGMQHDVIDDVLGRVGKVIVGKKECYPSLTLYYVFKNLAAEHNLILNYQAIQKQKGKIDLYIDNFVSLSNRKLIIYEFMKYFKSDLDLTIIDNTEFKTYNRKQVDFISELN